MKNLQTSASPLSNNHSSKKLITPMQVAIKLSWKPLLALMGFTLFAIPPGYYIGMSMYERWLEFQTDSVVVALSGILLWGMGTLLTALLEIMIAGLATIVPYMWITNAISYCKKEADRLNGVN